MAYFSKMSRSSDTPEDPSPESALPVENPDSIPLEKTQENQISDEGNGQDNLPINAPPAPVTTENPSVERRAERRFADKLKPLIVRILSSDSINRILFGLTDDLKDLFECDAVTIYALDRGKRQLYSRNFKSHDIDEIRLNVSTKSLAGFVAATAKLVNIANVYDKEELSKYHHDLSSDHSWDKRLGFKTKSAMVIPLAHNKRLMGVLEVLNKAGGVPFSEPDVRLAREISSTLGTAMVKLELEDIEEKIRTTALAIHSAETIDEILLGLQVPILQLFGADLITIYAVDKKKNEIYSKVKTGNTMNEIRVPISSSSIAGCVASVQKPINIVDVYEPEELKKYHPELTFDDSWDQKSGLRTKSMLVHPLIYGDQLLGVLQVVNKRYGDRFTMFDEKSAKNISDTLAIAFFNQTKTIKKRTKYGYLVENGTISQDELNSVISRARSTKTEIEYIFLSEMKLNRSDIGKSLELYYNVPYNGYSDSVILQPHIFSGLNKNYLAKNNWIPLQSDPGKATILVDDPANKDKMGNIQMIFPKKKLEFRVGLKADIHDFLNASLTDDDTTIKGDSPKIAGMSSLLTELEGEQSATGETPEDDEANAISETDSTIVRLVNKVLIDAYDQGISDIHIEPGIGKKNMKVRFRKDGICKIFQEIPYLYKNAIISRIKIMAKLDIAERRLPQDGKIKMKYGHVEIEYRVATCPTVGGNEDAVLRILAASKPIPLEKMNFSPRNFELTKDKVTKPYGLILVVGPTGSGKTTTLHSCLGFINTPAIKIWTAEDPVEITQEGLRQVQMLNKIGLDFARAMRSFLRGDPDVIMVGEMRDAETCAIGLEASLTGHLVFSTLHTNSAPETITRLVDMGMNPLNFADALLLIVAQRLVRTLCKNCKEDYHPNQEEFDTLVKQYGEDQFPKLGIEYTEDLMLKRPVGCVKCDETGYSGRTGLHELLDGTTEIKLKIMKGAMVGELRNQAIADGMTTLKQDGIYKVFKGDCDLKQVLCVCIV